MTTQFDRRRFLMLSAGATAGLTLPSFAAAAGASAKTLVGKPVPAYGSWKDVYRRQWTWDKVVRSTHLVNCWYQAHCAWDVYVKDGLVFREEQAAVYEKVNDELPDYNPRGCQKGGCFSQRMYDPTRITHPMRRVGPRGGGRWERISWDEAMTEIADTWIDVAVNDGTDRVILELGPSVDTSKSAGAAYRISRLTQAVTTDMNTEIGDGRRGTMETFGTIFFEGSADDYFYSDLILFWAGNPLYTHIPNAHFFTEAKYRGAKIISIAPDYNASAIKSDLWVPLKPGTDAALGLGVARLLIEQGLIQRDFLREQTDMPLLVRSDNRHFLTAADVEEGGKATQFYLVDEASGQAQKAPSATLALGALKPALEAKVSVKLKDGSEVEVRTVFDLLRERLAEYTPEKVGEICGLAPGMVKRLAKEIGAAKRMKNIAQSTYSKFYHGNLAERAQILIFALTGQIGRRGAGYSGFPMLDTEGIDAFIMADKPQDMNGHVDPAMQQMVGARLAAGDTMEQIVYDMSEVGYRPGSIPGARIPVSTSGTLFWQVHGGVSQLSDNAPDWGRNLKRSVQNHLTEALDKGWQPCWPKPGDDPRMMFSLWSNPLRRIRGSQKVVETLLPKLKKFIVSDFRMTSSTRMADLVLPAATYYENTNLKYVTPLSPYITLANEATKPLGESKTDWEMLVMLVRKIQERARARGIKPLKSPHGVPVDLSKLFDEFSLNGTYAEKDGEKIVKHVFESGKLFGDATWEQTKEKGFARYVRHPVTPTSVGNMCEIPKDDSIVALTDHVVRKVPYATTTRRMQFYLDHPLYHEYDEVLPRHKAPPTIGGDHPLMLTVGKSRWSIHSVWRDNPTMLRLHQPEPNVLISVSDAAARGIKECDRIRVRNDIGEFVARATISPAMQQGQALIYQAWEHYQFHSKGDMNSVSPSPINPVELAGGAGQHLRPMAANGQASMFDRETRVEIERV